ncbi:MULTISPECIES: hypothetical protein [Flavobacteriaceae]|uniref:hypothetical protein n=1 Tax=Flavobacteriaceae TaxID=49546 RepID=UPI001492D25B|nr:MULTISPECIES: hypothetical protein [Allomuricauda]MDC6367443.1 hypothetical protein [Muricauda sp. AC10]
MKKNLILLTCTIAIMGLVSCENEQTLNNDIDNVVSESLIERTLYVDGESVTAFTDESGSEPMVLQDGLYIPLSEVQGNEQLVYYLNAELEDYIFFTSKDKMLSIIEDTDQYSKLVDKIKKENPSMIKTISTKGASANSGSPSFTIATASNLGGYTFTKALPYPSRYGNPHLRCNQYETGCINFNDEISSVRLSGGVSAEFYDGSFPSPGARIYLQGPLQVNLNNWNDRITSFWASTASTYESNLNIIFPGNTTCGHNYNDPLCP